MPNYVWGTFGVLMVAVATGLYLMGYRWYDHDATGLGALVIILLMGTLLSSRKGGRWK